MTIPWGDVSTAYHSTGIPDIEVYMSAPLSLRTGSRAMRLFGPLLAAAPAQVLLKKRIRSRPEGPSDEEREGARASSGRSQGRRGTHGRNAPGWPRGLHPDRPHLAPDRGQGPGRPGPARVPDAFHGLWPGSHPRGGGCRPPRRGIAASRRPSNYRAGATEVTETRGAHLFGLTAACAFRSWRSRAT